MGERAIRVNGEPISRSEIRTLATQIRAERETADLPLSVEDRLRLFDEAQELLIDRLLLLQEARALGIRVADSEVDDFLVRWVKRGDSEPGCRAGMETPESRQQIERQLTIEKLLARWREAVARPRLAELQKYYRARRQEFYRPDSVHVSHMVRHFETSADRDGLAGEVAVLRERVLSGEPFSQVAVQCSDCPENGGDLGWIQKGMMVEEFENVAFTAPVGQVTPVFQTVFGYHIVLVHARRPAGIEPFDGVKASIENSLWLAKQDAEVGRALERLRAAAVITSETV